MDEERLADLRRRGGGGGEGGDRPAFQPHEERPVAGELPGVGRLHALRSATGVVGGEADLHDPPHLVLLHRGGDEEHLRGQGDPPDLSLRRAAPRLEVEGVPLGLVAGRGPVGDLQAVERGARRLLVRHLPEPREGDRAPGEDGGTRPPVVGVERAPQPEPEGGAVRVHDQVHGPDVVLLLPEAGRLALGRPEADLPGSAVRPVPHPEQVIGPRLEAVRALRHRPRPPGGSRRALAEHERLDGQVGRRPEQRPLHAREEGVEERLHRSPVGRLHAHALDRGRVHPRVGDQDRAPVPDHEAGHDPGEPPVAVALGEPAAVGPAPPPSPRPRGRAGSGSGRSPRAAPGGRAPGRGRTGSAPRTGPAAARRRGRTRAARRAVASGRGGRISTSPSGRSPARSPGPRTRRSRRGGPRRAPASSAGPPSGPARRSAFRSSSVPTSSPSTRSTTSSGRRPAAAAFPGRRRRGRRRRPTSRSGARASAGRDPLEGRVPAVAVQSQSSSASTSASGRRDERRLLRAATHDRPRPPSPAGGRRVASGSPGGPPCSVPGRPSPARRRIRSPFWKPAVAAGLSGATSSTITPSSPSKTVFWV